MIHMNSKHPLGTLIQNAMVTNGWSLRDLEKRAGAAGHRMSHTNFQRLRDEPVLSIRAETIRTLAAVLKVRESIVTQAALDSMGVQHGMSDAHTTLAQAVQQSSEISQYDQRLLMALLGVMSGQEEVTGNADSPASITQGVAAAPTQADYGKAAKEPHPYIAHDDIEHDF